MRVETLTPVVEAAPGARARWRLRVENDMAVAMGYRLRVIGFDAANVVQPPPGPPLAAGSSDGAAWEAGLESEAQTLLASGRNDVWDALSRRFESRLILTALANTRGRRIEAAQKLGIGRNTITRKIQELGLE